MSSQFAQLFATLQALTGYYFCHLLRAATGFLLGKSLLSHKDSTDDHSVSGTDISHRLSLFFILNLANFNFHSPALKREYNSLQEELLCFSYNSCFP